MIKRITASGGGSLEAKSGESLKVRRIEVVPSTNDTYLTVSIDRVTVAFYRVKGKSGNHLGTIHGAYLKGNIMEFLASRGVDVSLPIAEGQTLSVSRYAEAGNVMLIYDRYDAGDVRETDKNGSQTKEYTFLQYAKVGTAPTVSGDAKIDTSLTPSEFPDFPCGAVVPAQHAIDLLGIVGSAFGGKAGGTISWASQFLKLLKDREVLFDGDRNGIPFNGETTIAGTVIYRANFSMIGPGTETLLDSSLITPGNPLIFEPAIPFIAGQELNAMLTVIQAGTLDWPANVDDQAFILRVKRV